MPTTPIFEVYNLLQQYQEQVVLDITHLAFFQASIYCLYGPNGAGKTTLFELLTLLRKPTKGQIVFNGQTIYPEETDNTTLRSQVTLVHQDPLLFDTTVERNVDYGLRIRRIQKDIRQERVRECLQLVGLDGFQHRKARQLSGGETQRVAIARALSIRPAVLFLDEFSANVDETHRTILESIIHNIREQFGTTVIFTTHYLEQAYRVADDVIHLLNGRVVTSPLKNLFHGTITRENGRYRFSTAQTSFHVIADREGHATVAIPPRSIAISLHPVESSMRNHLQGTISHIIDAGDHVDLKVLAGEFFEITITKDSYHDMRLYPGMQVYLNFKVTTVKVF
ncbi:hypothetical protein CSA56_13790 [candidate division KSB3 bacterium]|uniref:Molybdenum ABC transporter ATP-binding protein n=1 Tax=candidate division KSB3 bacterium TaxID=2044937 RepID=A0A2G6KB41_9BACT|nr:MAG: hypothetical protein CSA56_13790 [candidate division KSB3 bacterium]